MAILNPIGNAANRVTQGIRKAVANKILGLYEYYRIKNSKEIKEMQIDLSFDHMPCVLYSDNRKVVTAYGQISDMCRDIGITCDDAYDIIRNKNGIFGGYIMHLDI